MTLWIVIEKTNLWNSKMINDVYNQIKIVDLDGNDVLHVK